MPELSNPKLSIKLVAGTNKVVVNASVKVNFFKNEEDIMKAFPSVKYRLAFQLWGEDGGANGDDDPLWIIKRKTIGADVTKTFGPYEFDKDYLDEDDASNAGADDIYAQFRLAPVSNIGFDLSSAVPVRTSTIHGTF